MRVVFVLPSQCLCLCLCLRLRCSIQTVLRPRLQQTSRERAGSVVSVGGKGSVLTVPAMVVMLDAEDLSPA